MKRYLFLLAVLVVTPVLASGNRSEDLIKIKSFYEGNRFILAVRHADKVIEESKVTGEELGMIYLYKGLSYFKMDQKYKAELAFEQCLKIFPDVRLEEENVPEEVIETFNRMKRENFLKLTVITEPEGAEVHMNGIFKGTTPLVISNLYSDIYEVIIAKSGYAVHKEQSVFLPGKDRKLEVELNKTESEGIVKISTEPSGADITISGIYKGQTPLIIDKIYPGEYTIMLEKADYQTYVADFYVREDEITHVNTPLERIRDLFVYSEVLPGLGQIIKGHPIHGSIFLGLITWYAVYYYDIMKDRIIYRENTVEMRKEYGFYYIGDRVVTQEEFDAEVIRRDNEREEYERYENRKSKGKAIGIALYATNIVDMVFLMVWDAHKENQKRYKSVSLKPVTNKSFAGLSLRVTF